MQDVRNLAICKLHPARITVYQAADAVGKSSGLMQLPLPDGKDGLHGISFAGGIREQINNQLFHKVVMEESPQKCKGFRIMYFCQIDKGTGLGVLLGKQGQYGIG